MELEKLAVKGGGKATKLELSLIQKQSGPVYQLEVPIVIYVQGQSEPKKMRVNMPSRQQNIEIALAGKPLRVDIDPEFDVFRRLDSREIPAALSQGFGDDKPLLVLPAKEQQQRLAEYRKLAKHWQAGQNSALEIVLDSDISQLPTDRSIWLLGWNNRFRSEVIDVLHRQGVSIKDQAVKLNDKVYKNDEHAVLLTARNQNNVSKTVLWLSSGNSKAIAGLADKLPHYRKYSYLIFSGEAPDNIEKGQWQVLNSPMNRILDKADTSSTTTLKPGAALVDMPAN